MYVATGTNSTSGQSRKEIDDASFAAGTFEAKSVGAGNEKEIFFLYKNKKKEVIKSDRIPLNNIAYIKKVSATDMQRPLKKVKVELDTNASSALVAGQDYLLRIELRQFYGMSDGDIYFKDAVVHCTSAMVSTPANFWTAMVDALNKAFSREVGATKTSNPYLSFTASGTYLTIEEKEQEWSLGTEARERVLFEAVPTTIFVGGEDVIWGKTTDQTASNTNKLTNGKDIADLEYFCLGERGDIYRNISWPNVVITEGLADASAQYDVLEIHYSFTDTGVNSYKSEKDITIAAVYSANHTVMNAVITSINAAAGSTLVATWS